MGVILLGYRGSGKTTIGRRLAETVRLPFIDTDELIVARAKETIREIFQKQGESYFRDLESMAVRDACARSAVIALGGGAILRDENRDCLLASSHIRVYLRSDARILHERIHSDPQTAENRPSLTHLGGNIAEIQKLLADREPLYRAVMTNELDVTRVSIETAVEKISKMMK